MKQLTIIGTVAYDSIKTPHGEHERILGGSASYASVAASLFTNPHIVSIIGKDFDSKHLEFFSEKNICTKGIEHHSGDTFHWKGYYEADMGEAFTVQTDLNVLLDFNPVIPDSHKSSQLVFCANIDPILQKKAIQQFHNPELVILDTMNFWIENSLEALLDVLELVDVLIINDQECRQLTGENNLIKALDMLIQKGPKRIIVKKGEHGSIMFNGNEHFICPAFPTKNVVDPTGAGDSFAGAFAGYLSGLSSHSENDFKKAVGFGALVSSQTVQDFSLNKLAVYSPSEATKQLDHIRELSQFSA